MAESANSSFPRQRLLVLASTYPRWNGDFEPGFVHELSRRLANTFDVHVVCPHAPNAASQEMLDGVTVHRFRYAPSALETLVQNGGILANLKRSPWKWCLVPLYFIGLMISSRRLIRQLSPHCLHLHWIIPQGLAILTLGIFVRNLPPFLLTSHGADLFGLRGRFLGALKRWVLRNASGVTVVSHPMVREVVSLGVKEETLYVMPMGVDFDGRFSLNPQVSRVAGQILFVGRLVEKKGVKYLIEALPLIRQRVSNAHLVIIGGGPELPELVALVSRLELQNWVEFRGPISQESLPEFYRQASVFVAPFVDASSGDKEGLGLVTVEAIACGCPVVVGDVPVVADIFLENEMDMRAIPGDPVSLAQKVGDVLVSPEAACSRVLEIRQRLARVLGWETVTVGYAELLKKMVGSS